MISVQVKEASMNSLGFNLAGTIAGLVSAGILFTVYLRLYRRIPLLESFTDLEQQILNFQLLAITLWTIGGLGFFFYVLWSGFKFDILPNGLSNMIIAFVNWVLLGFIAVTSLIPGVSIVGSLRSWNLRDPAKGQESLIIGVLIIALLAYWTWQVFLPSL
jgi:hypothetical protein